MTNPNYFQYIKNFKGKQRLARLFYKNKIDSGLPLTFGLKNGLRIKAPNLQENVSFELFISGTYEEYTLNYFVKNIPQNGVFIDVGANIGAISVLLGQKRPDIRIYAFEASPSVFQYLKANIEINSIKNIQIYNLALHNEDGQFLPFYSPQEKFGKGSFSPVFTQTSELVKTIRLDTFLFENNLIPDYIKVDVEGYELTVFQGLTNYWLKHERPKIVFEFVDWAEKLAYFNPGDAQLFLLKHGYTFRAFNSKSAIISDIITKGGEMILAV